MHDELIEKIARRLKCTTCDRRYRTRDFELLDQKENVAVMCVECRFCHKQSVILAVVQRRRVQPLYSELEPQEWSWYNQLPPVSVDDVIEIHRRMQAYEGDFTDVLEDPLPPGWSEE